jgi:demethylmenaquinone methyltransferase/2-methoxy-6-polyprenyl-1,4-benzoquinol methylase
MGREGTTLKIRGQFWLGLAAGLVAGSLIRQRKKSGLSQSRLNEYYRRRADSYNLTDYLFLGQFPRITMRKELMSMSGLKPGDKVLDFACGAGANFPYIMERIGPTGQLVGVDYSQDMLRAAGKVVYENGWQNVQLVQSDAATMEPGTDFDVVLCTLGLAVIPRYEMAMEQAWKALKPGGTYAIADICESERWYTRPIGFVMDTIDAFIIADSSRRPWEWLAAHGENYQRHELFFGYFYAATARKPLNAT